MNDKFFFVHRPLDGNGSITARVTSLTGGVGLEPGQSAPGAGNDLPPWAKVGVIVKDSTRPGSPYAAVMVTAAHGVRMQDNYTHDTAGSAGAATGAPPRWLRLSRAGGTLTGYQSADGTHWSPVGTASLTGLPTTVQAGLFTAFPETAAPGQTGIPTRGAGVFDHVSVESAWPSQAWSGDLVGAGTGAAIQSGPAAAPGGFTHSGGAFTVAGSGTGDIGPYVPPADKSKNGLELGAVIGLIVVIALGVLFITTEYRRGLIRTTLAANPRRGRVLAAKAIVIGLVTFAAGLAAAAVALPVIERLLSSHGYGPPRFVTVPLASGTGLRLVAGTAALLALAAVLALAAGAILRRSAGAVAAVIVLLVLPALLALELPQDAAAWLLRLTPAAAFSVQMTVPRYPQVACYVARGCDPLPPWAGLAVLGGYTVAALVLAIFLLRRRDV